jgi:hypothetical protein
LGRKESTLRATIAILSMVTILISTVGEAPAQTPGFGELYYDGEIVRTVVPPAAMPKRGRDDLYAIMNGVEGQLPVIAVAPGDRGYHGGQWAFHRVVWTVDPTLLTSSAEVLAAADAGDLTIERIEEMDFKCPVQP